MVKVSKSLNILTIRIKSLIINQMSLENCYIFNILRDIKKSNQFDVIDK